MPNEKLFAEWFLVDRWRDSRAFLLRAEPRGVYREMLSQAWKRGAALPTDHADIQALCNIRPDEWARCWPLISEFWRVEGDRLVCDPQLEIYAEAKQRAERASARGRTAAAARVYEKGKKPKPKAPAGPSWKFSSLHVSQPVHQIIITALGPRSAGFDFDKFYEGVALAYRENGEPQDRLGDLKRRAIAAASISREVGPPSVEESAARRAAIVPLTPEERAKAREAMRGILSAR